MSCFSLAVCKGGGLRPLSPVAFGPSTHPRVRRSTTESTAGQLQTIPNMPTAPASESELTAGSHAHCRLLLIDDDLSVKLLVERAVEDLCEQVSSATTAKAGLSYLQREAVDLVILDNILPDASGIDVLTQIHEYDSSIPVIFITARGTGATAIEAMKQSAFDYLPKPLNLAQLRNQVAKAIELKSMLTVAPSGSAARETSAQLTPSYLVGETPAMQEVFKSIGKSAQLDIAVLIRGEHGTGKESVAKSIHEHSQYAEGSFVKLHCPAFDEARFETELFGFVDKDGRTVQAGKLELAAGGTLVLQEIGNLPLPLQSKIMRVLREGTYEPIGSDTTQRVRCRILATSTQDLETLVREGHMRADLYYLLSAFVISLPPLRQRRSDLPLLIDRLLEQINLGPQHDKQLARISPAAMERLCQHTWPGNIDELYSVLKRSLIEAKGNVILSDTLIDALSRDPVKEESPKQEREGSTDWHMFVDLRVDAESDDIYGEAVTEMERKLLSRILQHTAGNQAQAAKLLGITRTSLRKKLRQLSISAQHVQQKNSNEAKAKIDPGPATPAEFMDRQ